LDCAQSRSWWGFGCDRDASAGVLTIASFSVTQLRVAD
jgi:hypothetical protein